MAEKSVAAERPLPAQKPFFHMRAGTWAIALLVLSACMSFYHLGGGSYFEPTDCWVAQTAREMLEANEWLMPRFAGEPRLQKSPGPYWAVMLLAKLRGGVVDEVVARMPSAIASVVTALTVYWLTLRIAGLRAAVFAGFAAASSGLLLYWSHRAASDLGLTACTTLSLSALWIGLEADGPRWRCNAFILLGYTAAGLGMLYKLPMPLVVVGLPAILYVLIFRRWSVFRAWGVHLVGLVLFCASWLPWVITILATEPRALAKWRVEFVDRFSGELPNVAGQDDWRFWFFYLLPLVVFTLPYAVSLPGALAVPLRKALPEFNRRGAWFCLMWFVSLLVFFTVSTGKEMRYLLPALPPLFVLLGIDLADLFSAEGVRRRAVRVGVLGLAIATPIIAALIVFFTERYWFRYVGVREPAPDSLTVPLALEHLRTPLIVTTAIFCVAAIASAAFFLKRRGNMAFACAALGTCATWAWAWPNLMPILASESQSRDFAAQLVANVPRDAQKDMRQIATHDARVIWYSDFRFPRLIDPLDLLEEQSGRRSLAYEHNRYGEEMYRTFSSAERRLLVMGYPEYAMFASVSQEAASEIGEILPPTYVWLRSRWGHPYKSILLVSNQPPPGWEALRVEIPEKHRERFVEEARARLGAEWRELLQKYSQKQGHSASAPSDTRPAGTQ